MPVNRNALIRYKTIDKCLQNRYRKWTLDDLIDACSDALYEYEGIDKGISKRTVQLDIQMMRSDKLGYNAPIIVYDNKYYTYEDPEYSITNIPLTDQDLSRLTEAVEFMKQFKGFSHFRELDGMVQKLEDHVYSQKTHQKPVIDFEKNENLKGLEFLDDLYKSIIQYKALKLTYQSFKARQASSFYFHPYLLKEFRNRWFLIGAKKAKAPLLTLALDRILAIEQADIEFVYRESFNAEKYFRDVIGVTVSPNQEPEKIRLFVTHKHAQYVITKPLHSSQKLIEKDGYGIIIELDVQHNFELEKEILGLGDGVMVVSPERLKKNIRERLGNAIDLYNTAISEKGIVTIQKKLNHKGFAVVNHLYTRKALRQVSSSIDKMELPSENEKIQYDLLMNNISCLRPFLINKNIERITSQLSKDLKLSSALFYQYIPNEMFEWGQSNMNNAFDLIFFFENSRIQSFTMNIIPGSHNKLMDAKERDLIVNNCTPSEIQLFPGGAVLVRPLLIHRFSHELKDKKLRFMILRFSN